jgi:hypothetical protein
MTWVNTSPRLQNQIADDVKDIRGNLQHSHDADGSVDVLADDAVTTAKIADANVTEAKLATDSVTTDKIADANVTAAKIHENDKFAADTVMAFGQNYAPTGWTRLTTGDTLYDAAANNAMFCFAKSGNVAAGGSTNPQAPSTTHYHTGPSHTHTMGTHNHKWYDYQSGGGHNSHTYNSDGTAVDIAYTDTSGRGIGTSQAYKLNFSGYTNKIDPGNTNSSGTGNTGAKSTGIQPYYIEMILAKKD